MSDLAIAAVAPPQATTAANPTGVVTAVVESVQAHPEVHPSKAASVAAAVLAGLVQAEPSIFGITRAGGRTQARVSLGLGLAEVILSAFLQPKPPGSMP